MVVLVPKCRNLTEDEIAEHLRYTDVEVGTCGCDWYCEQHRHGIHTFPSPAQAKGFLRRRKKLATDYDVYLYKVEVRLNKLLAVLE